MSIVKSVKNPCMNSKLYHEMINFLGFRYNVTRTIRITYSYHGEISAVISITRSAYELVESMHVCVNKETKNSDFSFHGDDLMIDVSENMIRVNVYARGKCIGFLDNRITGDVLIEFDEH